MSVLMKTSEIYFISSKNISFGIRPIKRGAINFVGMSLVNPIPFNLTSVKPINFTF